MRALADRLEEEAPRSEIHGTLEAASLCTEAATRIRTLEAALARVKRELMIPAAEYVPAIPAVWEIIDAAMEARS